MLQFKVKLALEKSYLRAIYLTELRTSGPHVDPSA